MPNTFAPPEFRKGAPLLDRFDMRFHPDQVGWAVGKPSGDGVISAWFRLADGREPDPLELLMVVDALPPVTFELGRMGWAPTLELTAHVRARPAPRLAEGAAPDPQPRGRDVRGGLRGVGLRGPAGRPVASARAGAEVATQTVAPTSSSWIAGPSERHQPTDRASSGSSLASTAQPFVVGHPEREHRGVAQRVARPFLGGGDHHLRGVLVERAGGEAERDQAARPDPVAAPRPPPRRRPGAGRARGPSGAAPTSSCSRPGRRRRTRGRGSRGPRARRTGSPRPAPTRGAGAPAARGRGSPAPAGAASGRGRTPRAGWPPRRTSRPPPRSPGPGRGGPAPSSRGRARRGDVPAAPGSRPAPGRSCPPGAGWPGRSRRCAARSRRACAAPHRCGARAARPSRAGTGRARPSPRPPRWHRGAASCSGRTSAAAPARRRPGRTPRAAA